MSEQTNKKLNILERMYNYDDKTLDLWTRKKLMHNNIARTKAVDKLCKFIIKCTKRKIAKEKPEITLEFLKNFCEQRIEINKEVRIKSNELIHKINLEKNSEDNTYGDIEWIN